MAIIPLKLPHGNKKIAEATFERFRAARNEFDANPTFANAEEVRKAFSAYTRIPDDEICPAPEPSKIRLIGGSALHHDGTVLQVVDNEAIAHNCPLTIPRQQAEALVARGDAEWVFD